MKLTLKMHKNGYKILSVKIGKNKSFSIATNGNLPTTHQEGVGPYTKKEVINYIEQFGTKQQKEIVKA